MKFSTREMVHEPVAMAPKEKQTLRSLSETNEELEWDELEWKIENYSSREPVYDVPVFIQEPGHEESGNERSGPECNSTEGHWKDTLRERVEKVTMEKLSIQVTEFVETTVFSETTRFAETIKLNKPRTKLGEPKTLVTKPTNVGGADKDATKNIRRPKKLIPPATLISPLAGIGKTKLSPLQSEPTTIGETKVVGKAQRTKTRRKVPLIADLSIFSEIDLGQLQSEDFRNKSIRAKSSSFANRVSCYTALTNNNPIKS